MSLKPISPDAEKLLQIIKRTCTDSTLSRKDSNAIVKNEFLMPENIGIYEKAGQLMLELRYAGYLEYHEPESAIPDSERQRFWTCLADLDQTGEMGVALERLHPICPKAEAFLRIIIPLFVRDSVYFAI